MRLHEQGVNGTLAGSEEGIAAYIRMMCEHPVFRMTEEEFKHSWAGGIEEPFPDLNIKVLTMSRPVRIVLTDREWGVRRGTSCPFT
jgi:predicted sulfurtransferase